MATQFQYTGREELAQANLMPGYNAHIASLFSQAVEESHVVLDFGAGTGTISELVHDIARPARILCVEIDPTNVAELRSKGFDVFADVAACPPESVDVIISSNVLEHVPDDLATLKKLYACLKPGGRAVFWVPAFELLWTPMDDRVEHYRRYTRARLASVFERAGFSVKECVYQDSLGFFVTLLFKLVGSRDGRVSDWSLKLYDRVVFPASRACDRLCSRLLGKNVVIFAEKPARVRAVPRAAAKSAEVDYSTV